VTDSSRAEQIAMAALTEEASAAMTTGDETQPDQAVELPLEASNSADTLLEASRGDGGTLLKSAENPVLARAVANQRHREESERARLWAEMRYRERQDQVSRQQEELRLDVITEGRRKISRRLGIIAAAALLLIGGGTYCTIHIMKSDQHLTAASAWEEFANDTPGASQKYKGKFVQLTGRVKMRAEGQANHLSFEAPENAKWEIEFTLPAAQAKELKDGQEITIRCRFGTRKESDGNLLLSNCTLQKES